MGLISHIFRALSSSKPRRESKAKAKEREWDDTSGFTPGIHFGEGGGKRGFRGNDVKIRTKFRFAVRKDGSNDKMQQYERKERQLRQVLNRFENRGSKTEVTKALSEIGAYWERWEDGEPGYSGAFDR